MNCTWKECTHEGSIVQKDKNGNVWATLCKEHDSELTASLVQENPKLMLRSWILAVGGAEKMTERIFDREKCPLQNKEMIEQDKIQFGR